MVLRYEEHGLLINSELAQVEHGAHTVLLAEVPLAMAYDTPGAQLPIGKHSRLENAVALTDTN